MFNLTDKTIVVTGGSGNLGREFTKALLLQGARVATIDLIPNPQTETTHHSMHIQADVTDRHAMQRALAQITDRWQAVPFGLINNAAVDAPPDASAQENGPFENYPETSWDRAMHVNTKGSFIPSQIFGGAMAEAGRGSIINISSIYGVVSPDQRIYAYRAKTGNPFCKPVAYSVSKSAVLNFTRYLATYWGPQNVRVNTLTFGGVFNSQDPEFLAGYKARVPLGRMANPDEYNGVVIFLMSEASSYMTGANLVVDGGWTAW